MDRPDFQVVVLVAVLVEVVHDWVDYSAAAGGLAGVVGAIVAVAALIQAKSSARDSAISAEAAKDSLEKARLERELKANPDAELDARAMDVSSTAPPGYLILDLGIINIGGTRAAQDVRFNVYLPLSFEGRPCDGEGVEDGDSKSKVIKGSSVKSLESVGNISEFNTWLGRTEELISSRHVAPRHLRVDRPQAGQFWIWVRVSHEDLPDGERMRKWSMQVPTHGDAVIVRLDEPDVPDPSDGDSMFSLPAGDR